MRNTKKLIAKNVALRLARIAQLPAMYVKTITAEQAEEEAVYYARNGGDLRYWNSQIEKEINP